MASWEFLERFIRMTGKSPRADDKEAVIPADKDVQQEAIEKMYKSYLRKIFYLLATEITIFLPLILLFLLHTSTTNFIKSNYLPFYLTSFFTSLVSLFILSYSKTSRRKSPSNYILLAVFTISTAFSLAVYSTIFPPRDFLVSLGIFSLIGAAVVTFAVFTKWDFTGWHPFRVALSLFLVLMMCAVWGYTTDAGMLFYNVSGIFVIAFWLLYDTQMVAGWKCRMIYVSPEEYIFATVVLLLDLVLLLYFVSGAMGGVWIFVLLWPSSVAIERREN